MSEPQPPTYEAFCRDIQDTRDNPDLMLRLIASLKRLVREGAFCETRQDASGRLDH